MFYGKIILGLIGLMTTGSVFGLILGVAVGHAFDRGLVATLKFGSPENIERIKASFFETTFLLSGYVAKSDGRVSENEIKHTELVFDQMKLSVEQRARAIELFRQGAAGDFQIEPPPCGEVLDVLPPRCLPGGGIALRESFVSGRRRWRCRRRSPSLAGVP